MVKYKTPETTSDDAALDAVFSALADPTRRAIVARLANGPANVGELADPFDMSLPAVSKHLKILERAGLLERERIGRVHQCRLDADAMDRAQEWLQRTRAFWEARLDSLARYLDDASDTQEDTSNE